MGVMFNKIGLGVAFLLLFDQGAIWALGKRLPATAGDSMEKNVVLYSRSEVLTIPLGESGYGLTYDRSDLGPASDRVPRTVAIHPTRGVFLIDPGPAGKADPALERIDLSGRLFFRTSLKKVLGLSPDQTLLANNIFLGNDGLTYVLVSFASDPAKKEHVLASFGLNGALHGVVKLRDFVSGYPVFRSSDGDLWAYGKSGGRGKWSVYDSQGTFLRNIEAPRKAGLLSDGRLIAFADDGSCLHYDRDGKGLKTVVKGGTPGIHSIINGLGSFIGALFYPESEWRRNNAEDLEQPITVTPLFFDVEFTTLIVLPRQVIAPNVFDPGDAPRHFVYHDPELMSLDEQGTLYVIARYGPENPRLVLFRMQANQAALKRYIRIVGEEK